MVLYSRHYFFWILLLIAFAVPAKAGDGVTILVDAYNPPNMYIEKGKAAGLYNDLLKAISERMYDPIKVKAVPWKRALDGARAGAAGIGGIYKNPERLKIYDYSDEIFAEQLLVFVKQGHQFEFNKMEDLYGKMVGVILGWSYGAVFDAAVEEGEIDVSPVNRDELNFKKLSEGRIDCVVASRESGFYQITKGRYDNLYPLDQVLLVNPTYIAFSKHSNMKSFLSRFNEALDEVKSSGEYDRIIDYFYETRFGRSSHMPYRENENVSDENRESED